MTVPATYDARRGIRRWFFFGNDVYGDCTVAAVFHLIMVHNVASASTWKKLIYRLGFRPPHDKFVVEEYTAFLATLNEKPSGTTGVDPNQFFPWLQAQGRIKDWASIPMTTDWDSTIRNAIFEGDGCLIALNLTKRSYDQGSFNYPWTLNAGELPDPNLGHAVAGVSYATNDGVVTWGNMKEMSPEYANACVWGVWTFN